MLQKQLKEEGSDGWNLVSFVIFVRSQFLCRVILLNEDSVQQHLDEVGLRSSLSSKAQFRHQLQKEFTATLLYFLDFVFVITIFLKSLLHAVQLQLHTFHCGSLKEVSISFPKLCYAQATISFTIQGNFLNLITPVSLLAGSFKSMVGCFNITCSIKS